jgi:hypothetical protein
MKSLPPNARAMGIAEACGKPTQVYGDVFIGRLYEDADDFVRLNFELKVRATHLRTTTGAAHACQAMWHAYHVPTSCSWTSLHVVSPL